MRLVPTHPTIMLLTPAFEKLGYSVTPFKLGRQAYTRFQAPSGGAWLTRNAKISYPFINLTCRNIIDNKHLAYELCSANGIATPRTVRLRNLQSSQDELAELLASGPVVVKPNNSRLSWGVTLDVTTPQQLEAAFSEAQKFSNLVLAQQQLSGQEVRFVVVDGAVKAAILKQPAQVAGDGRATLAQLIERENQFRRDFTLEYVQYPALDDRLIDFKAFDMDAVPAIDDVVALNQASTIRGGASIINVIDRLHDSYKQAAVRAVALLDSPFTVVDFIIKDLQAPLSDDNYIFLEFNSAPALLLFYSCRQGGNYDVVQDLSQVIDRYIRAGAA